MPLSAPLPPDRSTPAPRTGVFYGWWIVAAGTAVLTVSSGIGFYGHGVILDPLQERYGWSKGMISAAVTLYFATSGVMGVLVGRLVDEWGPRPVLVAGSTTIGLAFVLLSRVTEVWQFFAVYFLMSVGWSGTSVVCVTTLIANWFIRRRGLAMGLTLSGLSLGGVLLVPLATHFTARWGLEVALPLLGATFWLVIIPAALFVIKRRPSDVDQFPDGDPARFLPDETSGTPTSRACQVRAWTRAQALRTTAFWAIVASFFLALGGQIAFLVHQVSFLSQTLGRPGAASAVSLTAGASIVGRLILGSIADRSDRRSMAAFCFLVQGLAILSLAHSRHIVVLYLGTFAFGLTMGGILLMQSLLIGECFGLVSFGTISGLAGLFSFTGAAFGPAVAGFIFDATQDYSWAFTLFAAASLLAMGAVYFARPPQAAAGELRREGTLG